MPLATAATLPVSVVVPAYGHADYVLASLDSVLSQRTPPREVIVVDDSSPDDTAARIAPLASAGRIRYVRQPNAGMANARNTGAGLATGEYLYFLDDDDLAFPTALGWLVAELDAHPDAAMAFGDMVIFADEPPVPVDDGSGSRAAERIPFMLFNQLGSPGQVLIRRTAFLEVGGFDADIWGTDDWDLWLRLLARYPARAVKRPVVAYRLHADNASRDVARMYRSSLEVARRHIPQFPLEDQPALRRYSYRRLRKYHARRLRAMAFDAARHGRWKVMLRAVRAWALAWALNVSSYLALKANLVRQGRWRLPSSNRVARWL